MIAAAVAGGLVGVALSLLPSVSPWGEIRHFQVFLLEIAYKRLDQWLSPSTLRALGTVWGERAVLGGIGLAIGLIAGMIHQAIARVRGREPAAPARVALSASVAGFAMVFAVLWCRVVLVHSSTRRMVSVDGAVMMAGCVAFAAAFGLVTHALLRLLSRRRLEPLALAALFGLTAWQFANPAMPSGVPAVAPADPGVASPKQVILLGTDGATWNVALPMIREGRLPNIATLMARGAWGDVRATLPWKSPIIWTSIATGKRENDHGIHDFVVREEAHHSIVPTSIAARKVKALWDIASEAGQSVDVVGWYGSWPVETISTGTFVSDRALKKALPHRVAPESRTTEVDQIVERVKQERPNELPILLEEYIGGEVGLYLLEKDRPRLHLMYMRDVDDMQHLTWREYSLRKGSWLANHLYSRPPEDRIAREGTRIETAYEHTDAVLGRIMQLAGPDATIILVSDHGAGIKSQRELRFSAHPLLAGMGWFAYAADGKTADWTKSAVYDASKREWYERRELFVNEREEGPFGGPVDDAKRRSILDAAAARLRVLKTSDGERVFERIRLTSDPGEPLFLQADFNTALERHPDSHVTVDAEPGTPGTGASTVKVEQIVWRTELSGTHRLAGLLAMAGPGIRPGTRIRAASVLDVTPTILHLLDLPAAKDMDGRVLEEVFDPAWRGQHPVRWVDTYETGAARAVMPAQKSEADEEMREQLRALGYIQ